MKKKLSCWGSNTGIKTLSAVFFVAVWITGDLAFALGTSTNLISSSIDKAPSNILMAKDVREVNMKTGNEGKVADNSSAPRMAVNFPIFDAGVVFSGDIVVHDFVMKNIGGSPLRILSAKTS